MSKQHRILVTGADGFVGQVLQTAVATHPQASQIELHLLKSGNGGRIDICDAQQVSAAVENVGPTALIHLAAIASPRVAADDPALAWKTNVMGTFNLAHALRSHSPKARFVFAGSSEVYGRSFASGETVAETGLLQPTSAYGATKAAADVMLGQMAEEGLRTIRFRPFNHSGAGQPPMYVLPSFARQIARIELGLQKPVMRVGNLEVERDFLDVRDVVRAYLLAALETDNNPAQFRAFNLSTGDPVAISALLQGLINQSTTDVDVEIDPALVRPNEMKRFSGDATRAQNVYGWKREISLEDTLASILNYWRNLAKTDPDALQE